VGDDGRRGLLGRARKILPASLTGGELGRVRVEAEADLAAALLDERRKPIRERDQGRFSP
jgi:hypothetical protein